MSLFSAFLTFSFIIILANASGSIRRSKREDTCNDVVRIRECNVEASEADNLLIFYRIKTNQLFAIFQTECKFDSIEYRWQVHDEYSDKPLVDIIGNNNYVIRPFTLKKGIYGISVEVTVLRNKAKNTLFSSCAVQMESLKPIAVIDGGKERMVTANIKFLVDGSKSIDRDVALDKPGQLIYNWKCEILEGKTKDFCNKEFKTNSIEVPSRYALKNHKYLFKLTVKNKDSTDLVTTTQTITILENIAELKIICEKNCPPAAPATDKSRVIFLRVKCLRNCDKIVESTYEWSIEGASIDYGTQTQFGQNTDKFIIKENVLETGKTFTVRVQLSGLESKQGKASTILNVLAPIKIRQCSVQPKDGVAIETKFTVNCNFTGIAHIFEIFTTSKTKSVILTRNYRMNNLVFILPIAVEVYIKIFDVNGFQDVSKLNVNVRDSQKDITSYLDMIKSEISEADLDSVIQITNGIVEELQKKPTNLKNTKNLLLENLSRITVKSPSDSRQIANLVSRVVNDRNADSDPNQAVVATEICRKASETSLKDLKTEYYPTMLTKEVQENTKILMSCAETDTKENFPILQPDPLDFNITTPFPLLKVPLIKEDYPDYVNDESQAEKISKYEQASENYVGICVNTLQMLGLTIVEGEDTVVASTDNSSVQITRLIGEKLAELEVEIRGAHFQPSLDFQDVSEPIDLRICSWKNDPFWWNSKKKVVGTSVVLIEIIKNKKAMKSFTKPNRISFDIVNLPTIKIHEIQISDRAVVRIEVKKNESFFVEFQNLEETDRFRVLITNFKKPQLSKVKLNWKVITKNFNGLHQDEENGFDSWYYLNVLPEPLTETFTYRITVVSKSCYSWDNNSLSWEFACKSISSTQKDKIDCSCSHLSLFSGIVYNNEIKVDRVLYDSDFEMILIRSWIIFISLCTTFGLYCFLLIMKIVIRKTQEITYFLPPDISPYSRYVYLIRIRTGKRPSSGTTSNICIQLFGNKNESKSHILNYPDPQKRMFQRNGNDWFIIPTDKHLGNVKEIDLWIDYSGRQPSWFCQDVEVYDLQKNQKWYFHVNKWFDLPPQAQIFIKTESSEEKHNLKFKKLFIRFYPKWILQNDFSYERNLTLWLSIILLIFLNCLIFYGFPRLKLSDGFQEFEDYNLYPCVFWIAVASSVVSFLSHSTLIWLFRIGDQKLEKSKKIFFLSWFLLITIITVLMTVLTVYGFWIPEVTGYLWLTSVFLSLLIYIFILENLFEIILHFIIIDRLPIWEKNLKNLITIIETQRNYLFKQFGTNLLRPYFSELYKPLDDHDIKERKLKSETIKKLLILIEDTVMFSCYVTLLYLAIFANKNSMTVRNHDQMLSLVSGINVRNRSYSDINSMIEIYEYINNSLIPTLHSQQWYSRYVVKEPGMMADFHHKFLGVARLRQKRVILKNCSKLILNLPNETCKAEYYLTKEDKEAFGPNVGNFSRLSNIWVYTKAKNAGLSVFVGRFGVYLGGGFISPLGRTRYNSYANLVYLKNNSWLDLETSVIIIEFLTYNVNTNLFNAVRIVIERSVTGYLLSTIDLNTSQFLFLKDEEIMVESTIFFSFILILVIFTIKCLTRLWKGKFLFWRDLWILVDLFIIGLSYGSFVVFLHRAESVKKFLDKIESMKKNEFINYFNLLYEDQTFLLVSACLVFIATIRLWKVCRFGTNFKIMEKTIIMSFFSIVIVAVSHLVFLSAYVLAGDLLFSNVSDNFRNLPSSLVTLMLMIVGLQSHFDFDGLISTNPILARWYYLTFMFSNLLFVNMYISVIMIYYYEAQKTSNVELTNIVHFLVKEFNYYKTSAKINLVRLKGGCSTKRSSVTPKSTELRYADCVTLPTKTLDYMCCVVLVNLRKYSMNEQEQLRLMKRVALCSINDDDRIDIFYSKKDEENIIKTLHDNKITKIARAVELILGNDVKELQKKTYKKVNYKLIINKQMVKFDFISEMLQTILRVVSNIEIN